MADIMSKANKRQAAKHSKKSEVTGPSRKGCGRKRNPMSGFGVDRRDNRVGAFQRVLKKEYADREFRKELAGSAAQHPAVMELRTNVDEMRALLETISSAQRAAQVMRDIDRVRGQIVDIDAALVDFGQKSDLKAQHKDAILAIRMSNGYLRHIVRDALFGALRDNYRKNAPLTDAMAS